MDILKEVSPVPLLAPSRSFDIAVYEVRSESGSCEVVCLSHGDIATAKHNGVLVRIHSGCLTSEVFHSSRCDCSWQLDNAFDLIEEAPPGVIIYLPYQEGRGHGLFEKVRSFSLMDAGRTSSEAFDFLGLEVDVRDYGPAISVLSSLGIRRIRLITNNPAKVEAALAADLDVIGRVPSIMKTGEAQIQRYLRSKEDEFGHILTEN